MIQQTAFFIPPDIQAGLDLGELVRFGGVVRKASGPIYKHLDEIEVPGHVGSAAKQAVGSVLRNPKAIVGAVAVLGIAAGGAAYAATKRRERGAEPQDVAEFKTALNAHLDAVREGRLGSDIIDRVISSLDAMEASSVEADTAISLSTEQVAMLLRVVMDSTKQIAAANSIDLSDLEVDAPEAGDDVVVDLRRRLEVQRRIFADAA